MADDELLIRFMVGDELRDAGFEVIEACNADEALAVLNSFVHIDLIFSDVRMPGAVDGLGLLAIVRNAFPHLPVILASGHLDPALAIANGASGFFAKPYVLEAVVRAVKGELEGPQDG